MNLFTKQKQTHRLKTNLWIPKKKGGRAGGGGDGQWEIRSLGLTHTHDYI